MRVRSFDTISPQIVDTTLNWMASETVIKPAGIILLEQTTDGAITKMKISNGRDKYRDLPVLIGGPVVELTPTTNTIKNPPVSINILKSILIP